MALTAEIRDSFKRDLDKSLSERPSTAAHVAAKFLSGAAGGIPEILAEKAGANDVFLPPNKSASMLGKVADVGGFIAGPGKLFNLAKVGASTGGLAARTAKEALKLGAVGTVLEGAKGAAKGDILSQVKEEVPFWFGFGAAGPLVGSVARRTPGVKRLFHKSSTSQTSPQTIPQTVGGKEVGGEEPARFKRVLRLPVVREFEPTALEKVQQGMSPEKYHQRLLRLAKKKPILKEVVERRGAVKVGVERKQGELTDPLRQAMIRQLGGPEFITRFGPLKQLSDADLKSLWNEKQKLVKVSKPKTVKFKVSERAGKVYRGEQIRSKISPSKTIKEAAEEATFKEDSFKLKLAADSARSSIGSLRVISKAVAEGRLHPASAPKVINSQQTYNVTLIGTNNLPFSINMKGSELLGVLERPQFKFIEIVPQTPEAGMWRENIIGVAFDNLSAVDL